MPCEKCHHGQTRLACDAMCYHQEMRCWSAKYRVPVNRVYHIKFPLNTGGHEELRLTCRPCLECHQKLVRALDWLREFGDDHAAGRLSDTGRERMLQHQTCTGQYIDHTPKCMCLRCLVRPRAKTDVILLNIMYPYDEADGSPENTPFEWNYELDSEAKALMAVMFPTYFTLLAKQNRV